MEASREEVLPYRTDAGDLARWVEARARGLSSEQLRGLGFSAKGYEGTSLGAAALGFYDAESGRLTARGRTYALASAEERPTLLMEALRLFAPYAGLLEAIRERGLEAPTDVQWIEAWWATHGYGNSQSNRMEGTAVFGRLVEGLGLARYVPGRRGHPTRIEWADGADEWLAGVAGAGDPRRAEERERPAAALPAPSAEPAASRRHGGEEAAAAASGHGEVRLDLGEWGTARLSLPTRLPGSEKRRLLSLLDVLITEVAE